MSGKNVCFFFICCILTNILFSCSSDPTKKQAEKNFKAQPKKPVPPFNQEVGLSLDSLIHIAASHHNNLNARDSFFSGDNIYRYYAAQHYLPVWSDTGTFKPSALQLFRYLDTASYAGLDPAHYHQKELSNLKKNLLQKKVHPEQWAHCDLLLTDAFFHILVDLKQGRLIADSLSWLRDDKKTTTFFIPQLNQYLADTNINQFMTRLEPSFHPYQELKKGLKRFVLSMDTAHYTRLIYPYAKNDSLDSMAFITSLHQRLSEIKSFDSVSDELPDSSGLSAMIKKYQKQTGVTPDGKISASLVRQLNLTDEERLKRIFISLDRYKMIADSLPDHFIWVNLPAFMLKIYQHDTVTFSSKVVCGKASTPTPLLSSRIDEMVIYPTWTVPPGIIKKEMIPGLQKNNNYLSRKGLKLYDLEGKRVDPTGVDWTKYTHGIPYKIVQSSGDRNALGVMKFNFSNPFSVYLHDTNQRGFFNHVMRALSHGCVRVEKWHELSHYISRNDSISNIAKDTLKYNADSLDYWIASKKSKRVKVKYPLKLFLQYVTCEGEQGVIKFHDDIYGEDKKMLDRFFTKKK